MRNVFPHRHFRYGGWDRSRLCRRSQVEVLQMKGRNEHNRRLVTLGFVVYLHCRVDFQHKGNRRGRILLVSKQSGKKRRFLLPSLSGTMCEQNESRPHLETANRSHSVLHALVVVVVCGLHHIRKEGTCKPKEARQYKRIDIIIPNNDIRYRNGLFRLQLLCFHPFRFPQSRFGSERHNRVDIPCT